VNVLRRKGDILYWDLNGDEVSHPIRINRGDDTFTLYAFLSSYSCREEKAVRNGLFNGKGETAYQEFIDKHFIKFVGMESSDPKKHRMYIDEMPEIKRFIYEECVQGIRNDIEPVDLGVLDEAVCMVPTVHDMYFPDESKEVQFKSKHYLNMNSIQDSAYEQCVENRSSEELLEVEINFDTVEKIYNDSVCGVEGFLLGDVPCMNSNKGEWAYKIPFEYKYAAIDEAFRPAEMAT